ncbi:MAG: ABC transporter permease [Anaerolineae bacterium]|nr:ABC transporter permease [Thermoflexales bacterium]MDW8407556.1 ABC transporter permease [Anaerolineae bacterium]
MSSQVKSILARTQSPGSVQPSSPHVDRTLPPVALAAAVIAIWELGVRLTGLREIQLPAPSRIIQVGLIQLPLIADHAGATLHVAMIGLALAVLVGAAFAFLMEAWPLAQRAVYPLLVVSQTVPTIAIAPLLVILFGLGILPKVIVVALVCFFPITVNLADGLRGTSATLVDMLRTFGATRWQVLRKVKLPAALPAFFSGLKVAVTYCVIGAVLGEWIAAPKGLGVFMLRSFSAGQTAQAFAGIVAVSLLTIALFGIVLLCERRLTRWHYRKS